jgi:hypothetical protein
VALRGGPYQQKESPQHPKSNRDFGGKNPEKMIFGSTL